MFTVSTSSERPSRLKGIETKDFGSTTAPKNKCSERPSRLKGIETKDTASVKDKDRQFGKTFPFEGNWNK